MDGAAELERQKLLDRLAEDEVCLTETADVLRDAAASLGILLRHSLHQDILKVAPLTLLPTIVPKEALDEILQLQCDINLLMHRVAHDAVLLTTALGGAASVDLFLRNLFEIYRQVDRDSQWELGLIRSDYILSRNNVSNSPSFKQVEVNMICIGLAALGAKVGAVHARVLRSLDSDLALPSPPASEETLTLYGEGLKAAYDVYRRQPGGGDGPRKRPPVILIVIHDAFEFNIMDQRFVEFAAGAPAIRRTFRQIAATASLSSEGALFVEAREVAVVYYRTGYSPDQYKDRAWEMRLLIEKSTAIKCPSVAHQLAGFKKVQQILSRPEVLQRVVPDQKSVTRMQHTFMGQWDLSEGDAAPHIAAALQHPERYVLKPNREGGGNNFYGQAMVRKINEVQGTTRAQEYILMAAIQPVPQENYLIRAGMPAERVQTVGEVGVFGVVLARHGDIVLNRSAGEVLIRSKAMGVHEGGVSTGHSCISSVIAV